MIYEKGILFWQKVLEHIVDNIENHRYPNDIHKTTGPTAYTKGIEASLRENPETLYRVFDGIEFRGYLKFKYKLGKFFSIQAELNIGNKTAYNGYYRSENG